MKTKFYVVALIAVSGLLSAGPVKAHHSLNSEFDTKKTVTLKGVITKVEWINPHIFLYVDASKDGGGVTEWAVETFPPNHMRSRYGLTKAVLAGDLAKKDLVTIELQPAANGKQLGWLKSITYPDGHEIRIVVEAGTPEAR